VSPALLGGLAAQSTLGAVLGLGGLWLLRHRSPLDRASWLKLALALLLALPWLPRVQVPMPAALAAMMPVQKTATRIEPTHAVPVQTSAAPYRSTRSVASPSQAPVQLPSVSTLALLAYGLGVAALLGHLALGLALLSRWTRRARPLDDRAWQHALRASGAPANTLLLVSDRVRAPLSWGLSRPVILIDPSSALRPADAPAILAHEAAHIAGSDWLALMAARVATALFWFNPLVWVLTRALVQHCEEAADASALQRCAPADYAETLMTCLAGRAGGMGTTRSVPANGMAAGHGLSRRVHQVLDAAPGDLLRRSRGVMVGLTGVASLAVAGSLVSFAAAADLPQLKPGQSWRTVHPDGTVESRYRDRNGDTTISVVKADGHHTTVRVVRNGGHSTVVSDDAADVIPPVPPCRLCRLCPRTSGLAAERHA
jgi:beta-lactamase regulating signal transducer with metallopeptidase domain